MLFFFGFALACFLLWSTGRYDHTVFFLSFTLTLSFLLAYLAPSTLHADHDGLVSIFSNTSRFKVIQSSLDFIGVTKPVLMGSFSSPSLSWLTKILVHDHTQGGQQARDSSPEQDKQVDLVENAAASIVVIISCGISAFGAILWQRSPFVGVLVYVVVTSLFAYDESWLHIAKVQQSMIMMIALLSILSGHILRLNLSSAMFVASSIWLTTQHQHEDIAKLLGYPGFCALALVFGLINTILHDVAVRFGYLIISGISQVLLVALTAFVGIETFIELLGFDIRPSPKSYSLLNRGWRDAFDSFKDNQSISRQVLHSLPVVSAVFCLAGVLRSLRMYKANSTPVIDNIIADILGLGFGGFAGVWLWVKGTSMTDVDITGPSVITFVAAMTLVRLSFILHSLPFPVAVVQTSWKAVTYWRKLSTRIVQSKVMNSSSSTAAVTSSSTTNPGDKTASLADKSVIWKVVNVFTCGVDPNVHKVALRTLEADEACSQALHKLAELRLANKGNPDQVAIVKAMYQVAMIMSTSSKLIDELLLKVKAVLAETETENVVLTGLNTNTSSSPEVALIANDARARMKGKLKESLLRHKDLINEHKEIEGEAQHKRMLMMKSEDDAIADLRETSIKVNGDKIPVKSGESPKDVSDELLRLAESLQTRRRKSKTQNVKDERTFQEEVEITKRRLATMIGGSVPSSTGASDADPQRGGTPGPAPETPPGNATNGNSKNPTPPGSAVSPPMKTPMKTESSTLQQSQMQTPASSAGFIDNGSTTSSQKSGGKKRWSFGLFSKAKKSSSGTGAAPAPAAEDSSPGMPAQADSNSASRKSSRFWSTKKTATSTAQ